MAASFTVPTAFKAVDRMTQPIKKMGRNLGKFAQKARSSFSRANRAARRFRSTVSTVNSKIFNMKNAGTALAGAFAAKRLKKFTDNVASAGDNVAKTARRIGVSTDTLEAYRFAAERSGVSSGMFDKAMESLGKRVGELQNGTGSLYSKLQKQGRTALIENLKNVDNNQEAFRLLSDAMQNTESSVQKQALATAAFSKTNQKVLQMMNDGTEGLEKYKKKWEQLGIGFSDLNIDAEAYKDQQEDMNLAITGAQRLIGAKLMPVVHGYMKGLTNWIKNNKELLRQKISEYIQKFKNFLSNAWVVLKSFGKTMSTVISVLWSLIQGFILLIKPVILLVSLFSSADEKGKKTTSMMQTLGTVLGVATGAIIAMNVASKALLVIQGAVKVATVYWTAAQKGLNVALTTNPIGAIIGAIAALIAVIYGLIKLVNWVVSALGGWENIMWALMLPFKPLIWFIKKVWSVWTMVKNAFKDNGLIGALKAIGGAILSALLLPVQKLLEAASYLPDWLGGGKAESAAKGIENLRKKINGLGQDMKETGKNAKEMQKNTVAANKSQGGGQGGGIIPGMNGGGMMPGTGSGQGSSKERAIVPPAAQQGQGGGQNAQVDGAVDINVNDPQNRTKVRPKDRGNVKTKVKKKKTMARWKEMQQSN